MASDDSKPLLVIVGPTASGKSELAMRLAQKYDGEIICADSRTVYKGLNIGTAKPSLEDQKRLPHHLLDVVNPNEPFTVFDFQALARRIIKDIRARGKTPFLVGGTGLYIDSVIFDYQFPSTPDKKLRTSLEKMTLEQLYIYCIKNNITLPENDQNKRYVIRTIERMNTIPKRSYEPIDNTIVVGVATKSEELRQKITQRAEHLFSHGVVEETRNLSEMYGWDGEPMTANIYRLCRQVIEKELIIEEAKTQNIILDWRLSKRQLTWLRRNKFIRWNSWDGAYGDLSAYLELYASSKR